MSEEAEDKTQQFYNSDLYQFRALWLRSQGREDEAAELYRQAAERTNSPQAHFGVGVSLLGKGQPAQAIAEFRQALRLKPGWASAYDQIARALSSMGKYEEALEMYQEVVRLSPGYCSAYQSMGDIYKQRGNTDAALQAYRDAIRAYPKFPEAHVRLAETLMERGDHQEAATILGPMVAEYPNFASIHLSMGKALAGLGKVSQACARWQRTVEIVDELTAKGIKCEETVASAEQARELLSQYQQ